MRLEDLKRGMKCTYRNGVAFIVSSTNNREIEYLDRKHDGVDGIYNINGDLTHEYNKNLDIMKVEDITLDGYKTIWEREEDKYYLKLPSEYHYDSFLNYSRINRRYYFFDKNEDENYKTQFTLDEIDNLPNQDFIQTLEKELVE